MKVLFLMSLIFLVSCSSTKTIPINSSTILNENERVDWAITKQDSIIDFRTVENKYAAISGDQIIYRVSKDSVITYSINEFRTIHTFEEAPISIMVLSSIVVTLAIIGYWFSGMKIG
jgi:hypothetical protein